MTYVPAIEPWAHQARALEKMRGARSFALRMYMRTGKTKVILDDFGRLEAGGECQDLCVIAPAGCYKTWVRAIETHVGPSLLPRLRVFVWDSGKSHAKAFKRDLEEFLTWREGPRVFLVNVEALSTVEAARLAAMRFLKERTSMCAVDESTSIRNSESARGRFVADQVRKLSDWRRILSGLLTPNSPLDLFNQFYFLDPHILKHWTLQTFKARYAETVQLCMVDNGQLYGKLRASMERDPLPRSSALQERRRQLSSGFLKNPDVRDLMDAASRDDVIAELRARKFYVPTVEVVKGYKHEEELRELIEPHSFKVHLSECYDLPPKMYESRHVELTREQRRIYEELKRFATAELSRETHVTATHVLSRGLRLHQVLCGHTVDELGGCHEFAENRTEQLLELLDETDGKTIIWCTYDHDVRKVAAAVEARTGRKVARFWGGNIATREAEEREFTESAAVREIVATPGAGKFGRQWDCADLVIYYSNDYNLEHRIQSEERAQLSGKTQSVLYVDLLTPGTMDEKIIYALREKIDMSAAIAGDPWQRWLV